MKRFIAIAMLTLLGGCWTGPEFYSQADSQPALAAGRYQVVDIVDPFGSDVDPDFGKRVKVEYTKDGQAYIHDASEMKDESSKVVFAPLTGMPHIYVVQANLLSPMVSQKGNLIEARSVYGLIHVTPDGYQLALPPCDGTRRIWEGGDATEKGLLLFKKSACVFSNREAFEAAMQKFAKDPIRWTTYRRVKG